MSILDEWIVFDTNIWIFGLRRDLKIPESARLLDSLSRLQVVLPRQILQELQANLAADEIGALFRLLSQLPERIKINWEKAKPKMIAKYQSLGCKLGDAVIASHLEEMGVNVLVTENRDFLEELRDLPFRKLSAAEALAELKQGTK